MSREILPQLMVDIGERLKDEFSPAPLTTDGLIWNAIERLKSAEQRMAAEEQQGTLSTRPRS